MGDAIRVARKLAGETWRAALCAWPDVKLEGTCHQTTGFAFDGGVDVAGQGVSVDLHDTIKD